MSAGYLLDTNVVSEVRKKEPHPRVRRWFESVPQSDLYLSVLVIGEIREGIERLRPRDPAQADVYEAWLTSLARDFSDRLLDITLDVADAWGRLAAHRTMGEVDGLMTATALVNGLILVTRDAAVHAGEGVRHLDPWI